MKVLVVGATGNIGRKTVAEALQLGHEVTAFSRSSRGFGPATGLNLASGDVRSSEDLKAAVPGHDAVILTFGAPLNRDTILRPTDICEVGTRNVVAAMQAHDVPRLIAMTSIGAGFSKGRGRWPFRNIIAPFLLRNILADRVVQEEVVMASGLPEWVIVQPAELTDGKRRSDLRHMTDFEGQPQPTTVARASVAAFLASMVSDKRFDGGGVLISD
ncbi:NAD(P)-dependent oxidoreductase [Actibacterium sp. 188UL27-1]|uniref:NAD(P)-dependent oxidoreductase n=1 Tax=Actibacterium sp. 188UL27-1 TaxID=2786961 RepID=UPI0019593857|nr:NAD(P)H-binding protein [Actibacterium sp. 188UL27-1]MBM7068926.1 NAD(P)H-binding protein [Actibacterium sp. 188UL27-1]